MPRCRAFPAAKKGVTRFFFCIFYQVFYIGMFYCIDCVILNQKISSVHGNPGFSQASLPVRPVWSNQVGTPSLQFPMDPVVPSQTVLEIPVSVGDCSRTIWQLEIIKCLSWWGEDQPGCGLTITTDCRGLIFFGLTHQSIDDATPCVSFLTMMLIVTQL